MQKIYFCAGWPFGILCLAMAFSIAALASGGIVPLGAAIALSKSDPKSGPLEPQPLIRQTTMTDKPDKNVIFEELFIINSVVDKISSRATLM